MKKEDLLEEIVGNIYDEYDEEESDIVKIGENKWRVAGSTELSGLVDEIGFEISEDADFSTLGGLIMNELSEIPEDGTASIEVTACGLHIKVERVEDRRIESAIVTKLSAQEEDKNR